MTEDELSGLRLADPRLPQLLRAALNDQGTVMIGSDGESVPDASDRDAR